MAQKYVTKKPYYGSSSHEPVKIKTLLKSREPIDAVAAFGPNAPILGLENKRLVLNGPLCVDHVRGSWRWGEEAAFNVWTRKMPKLEPRAQNDGYFRLSWSMPLLMVKSFNEKLLEKLWQLGV